MSFQAQRKSSQKKALPVPLSSVWNDIPLFAEFNLQMQQNSD